MDDPYIFVENLDRNTLEYSREQTGRFEARYGNIPEGIMKDVLGANGARRVIDAMVSGGHIASISAEGDRYFVSLDGKEIYSTGNVLTWISCDRTCRRIAFFETQGSDLGRVRILEDNKLKEEIEGNIGSIVFTESSYYVVKTYVEEPPEDGGEINSHRVLLNGRIVFGSGLTSEEFIHMHSSNGKAIVEVGNWQRSELFLGDFEDPSTWRKVMEFQHPVKALGFREDEIIYLERDGNGLVKQGDKVLVDAEWPIEDCVMVSGGLLILYLKDAKIHPAYHDFAGRIIREFDLGLPMGLKVVNSDDKDAVLVLHSFGIPFSMHLLSGGNLEKVDENRVLELEVKEKWAHSTGVRVHYFMVNSTESRDTHRVLAYGYGGYDISMTPMYSPLFVTLLKHGVSIALANLRGGGEYGEQWHESGIREKKQNVFDDFISVISSLRDGGYHVAALGASNGGLLVGSILTQRPDLLEGAVIGNPVLDMLRFHLMSVGSYWVNEFGNPEVPEDAEFLMKYSPYHNVRRADYPKTLIYTRLKDDRVHPAHAIKFHMRLSEVTDNAFLRANSNGGHIGLKPGELARETSENCNFILDCLGIKVDQ